jgi:hypothetical protein
MEPFASDGVGNPREYSEFLRVERLVELPLPENSSSFTLPSCFSFPMVLN